MSWATSAKSAPSGSSRSSASAVAADTGVTSSASAAARRNGTSAPQARATRGDLVVVRAHDDPGEDAALERGLDGIGDERAPLHLADVLPRDALRAAAGRDHRESGRPGAVTGRPPRAFAG